MIEKLSVWKWRMHIHTAGWHTFYFITFVSVRVTWWHGGIPGEGAAGSRGGAAVQLRLHRVCEFFAEPLWD
jgi:hypothetical protein